MSLEQDIYDLSEPSEIAVLRALLEQGTITMDDVVMAMNKKKVSYVKRKNRNPGQGVGILTTLQILLKQKR